MLALHICDMNICVCMCMYMYTYICVHVCAGDIQLSPMPLRRKTMATVAASNHSHAGTPLCQCQGSGCQFRKQIELQSFSSLLAMPHM